MSKLLDLLNPHRTNVKQVQTVERIAAIGHSSDAVGWRPVSYQMPERFERFLANLEADIDNLIATAKPDMYNATYYEEIVAREVEIALKELLMQRTDHQRSIHNIRIYQDAALQDIKTHIRQYSEALESRKGEYHAET